MKLSDKAEFTEAFRIFCDFVMLDKLDLPLHELGRFCYLCEYFMCEGIHSCNETFAMAMRNAIKTKEDALDVLLQWKYFGGNWMQSAVSAAVTDALVLDMQKY